MLQRATSEMEFSKGLKSLDRQKRNPISLKTGFFPLVPVSQRDNSQREAAVDSNSKFSGVAEGSSRKKNLIFTENQNFHVMKVRAAGNVDPRVERSVQKSGAESVSIKFLEERMKFNGQSSHQKNMSSIDSKKYEPGLCE